MIHLIGLNSFIGKNLYLELKKNYKITCYSHNEINNLNILNDNDIVINICGINRANTYIEYEDGNVNFLKKIINNFNGKKPYVIHFSSMAVNGFQNKNIEELDLYMQYFIKSKLEGEIYLKENYNNEKLLIIRPSNIFGYDCEPYYNNILVSMMFEKIKGYKKIININKNSIRNFLSVEKLNETVIELLNNKKTGIHNIMSSNTISLLDLTNLIYNNNIPDYFNINEGDISISNINDEKNNNIIIDENIKNIICKLEKDMIAYNNLKNSVSITKLEELIQQRGNMVEISDLNSKRLYKITLTKHSVRGNHYHDEQIEDFFVNNGYVYFLLANKENIDVIYKFKLNKNEKVKILPNIIHTLVNDFNNNEPEIIILSTNEYIKNIVLDTVYINIVNSN